MLASSLLAGCGPDEVELKRRQLLAADGSAEARQKRIDAARLTSPQGELLPSQTKVGGIVLPRGFEATFVDKHAWTYDGNFLQPRVEAYFERRLAMASVEKRALGEVVYLKAREKGVDEAAGGMVIVSPTPGKPEWTRVEVKENVPEDELPQMVDEGTVKERLAERRKFAR